jgi:predicted ATP-dependent endonuclease of OLD family
LELFFLRDDRRLTSSFDDTYALEGDPREHSVAEIVERRVVRRQSALEEAIENLNAYLRRRAMAARSRGEQDINKIYRDIIRTLARPGRARIPRGLTTQTAVQELSSLAVRNEPFRRLHLTTELPVAEIVGRLEKARSSNKPALLNVVKPYIDSLRARLDALEGVQQTISRLLVSLNSFLGTLKHVDFSLDEGLEIIGQGRERLSPRWLSSGERQLLTIFCQILRPQDHSTVFIIDEPELSLNVKWQRRLLQNLLDCTESSPIQFLIASHSMEILARHRDNVVVLTNAQIKKQNASSSAENG